MGVVNGGFAVLWQTGRSSKSAAGWWGSGLFVFWRRELLKSSLSLSGCLGLTGWSFQHHDHSPLKEETTPHCPVCTLGCTDGFKCNNWYQPIMYTHTHTYIYIYIYTEWYHIHCICLVPLSTHCPQQYSKASWLVQLYLIYCIIICKKYFYSQFLPDIIYIIELGKCSKMYCIMYEKCPWIERIANYMTCPCLEMSI